MINRFKRIICLLACLCMCFCFFACGGEASLSISGKKRISMEAGTTHVLSVQGLQTVEEYEWSSSDTSVATVEATSPTTAMVFWAGEGECSVSVSVQDSGKTASDTARVHSYIPTATNIPANGKTTCRTEKVCISSITERDTKVST